MSVPYQSQHVQDAMRQQYQEEAAEWRAQHLSDIAAEAAFFATDPPPLDRSNVSGLNHYEQMTERGD